MVGRVVPESDGVILPREKTREWRARGEDFDVEAHRDALMAIFDSVRSAPDWDHDALTRILAQHPRDSKGYFSKIELVKAYEQLAAAGVLPFERWMLRRLQLKPVRTSSGVAPVTVLTAPAGCPGRCIFCPDAAGMPKSYLPDEPGARRAAECRFDPFLQVHTRLRTLEAMGHTADKVELLILGGTWSAYPRRYREWFVQRCLDAMNGAQPAGQERASTGLLEAQARNESAGHRNVGLVIETRPDWVIPEEIRHLRRLGVTKVQLGVQSLDDRILALNQRGHDVEMVRRAVGLLRAAGFKLHLHWMPNLLGATPRSDREDFARLWSDPALRPDELKIYPCSIVEGTELYRIWQSGGYTPYADDELIQLVAECKTLIPPYCRVNRVFRDIPADDIVAGSKRSNLRQLVREHLSAHGMACRCIRCREVRGAPVEGGNLRLAVLSYDTISTTEHFLSFETSEGKLAGFLRLSLPARDSTGIGSHRSAELAEGRTPRLVEESDGSHRSAELVRRSLRQVEESIWEVLPEIAGAAMIRELHVYGPALGIGKHSAGEPQHLGLGRRLVAEAMRRARAAGFERLAVISAIGTRTYYEGLGFTRGDLYMSAALSDQPLAEEELHD
jgi:elongator complex protein 3